MSKENLSFGKLGENLAADFLLSEGYKIIARNFRTKLGEIDIIARDKGVICFIEVKSRSSLKFGLPQEAISKLKQRQITKVALKFLKENKLLNDFARFDVVTILSIGGKPKIDLIKNAFELDARFNY